MSSHWDTGQSPRPGRGLSHLNFSGTLSSEGSLLDSTEPREVPQVASVRPLSEFKNTDQEGGMSFPKATAPRPVDSFDPVMFEGTLATLSPAQWPNENQCHMVTLFVVTTASIAAVPLFQWWITHPISIVINIALLVAFGRKLVTLRRSQTLMAARSFAFGGGHRLRDTKITSVLNQMECKPGDFTQFHHSSYSWETSTVIPSPPPPYSPPLHEPWLKYQHPQGDFISAASDCQKINKPNKDIRRKDGCPDFHSYPQTDTMHTTPRDCSATVIDSPSKCNGPLQSLSPPSQTNELNAVSPGPPSISGTLGAPSIPPSIAPQTDQHPAAPLSVTGACPLEGPPETKNGPHNVEELAHPNQTLEVDNPGQSYSCHPTNLSTTTKERREDLISSSLHPQLSSHGLELVKVEPVTLTIAQALDLSHQLILTRSECRGGGILQRPCTSNTIYIRQIESYEFSLIDRSKTIEGPYVPKSLPMPYLHPLFELERAGYNPLKQTCTLEPQSLLPAVKALSNIRPEHSKLLRYELRLRVNSSRELLALASELSVLLSGSRRRQIEHLPTGYFYERNRRRSPHLGPVRATVHRKPSSWQFVDTPIAILRDSVDSSPPRRCRQTLHRSTRPKRTKLKCCPAPLPLSRPFYRVSSGLQGVRSCSGGFGWEPGGYDDGLNPFDFPGFCDIPDNWGIRDEGALWPGQGLGPEVLQGLGIDDDPPQPLYDPIQLAPNMPNPQSEYYDEGDPAVQQPPNAPPAPVPLPVNSQPNAHGPAWSDGFVSGCKFATQAQGVSFSWPQNNGPDWSMGFVAGCAFATRPQRRTRSSSPRPQTNPTGSSVQAAAPSTHIPATPNNDRGPPHFQPPSAPGNPIIAPLHTSLPNLPVQSVENELDNQPGPSTSRVVASEIPNGFQIDTNSTPQETLFKLNHASSSSSKAKRTCRVDGKHKCDECEETFHRKYLLNDHVRKHRGQPSPHVCNIAGCTKSFTNRANLRRHQKTHKNTTQGGKDPTEG